MITGILTTSDIVLHPAVLVREYGWTVFFRCCRVIVLRQRTTFLSLVFA